VGDAFGEGVKGEGVRFQVSGARCQVLGVRCQGGPSSPW
jgi:hypothetical protein